ncbi:MAG: hypothetical protein M1125_03200 [Candidatus Marsarchaeota archaeon]|nr:hypothetical protein [Candidatus Marsarchaeota archaeon]
MGKTIHKPNLHGKSTQLLRFDGQDASDYAQPRKSDYAQESQSKYYDEDDSEIPILYAAFENAFKDFKEMLRNVAIFTKSDALSSELAHRLDPDALLKRSLELEGAEPEMKQITMQLNEYKREYTEALDAIDSAREAKAEESEINKIKSRLFSAIVRSFDDYTADLGDATYEYTINMLYSSFIQIAKFRGKYALDIFDYFSMSDADPEYRRELYEDFAGDQETN